MLDHVKRLNHLDQAGFNVTAAITSLLPMPLVLYTGDDDGRVVSDIPYDGKYALLTMCRLVRVGCHPAFVRYIHS